MHTNPQEHLEKWEDDCMHWHGKVLQGEKAHWCPEWDGLPIDETCAEFESCICDLESNN